MPPRHAGFSGLGYSSAVALVRNYLIRAGISQRTAATNAALNTFLRRATQARIELALKNLEKAERRIQKAKLDEYRMQQERLLTYVRNYIEGRQQTGIYNFRSASEQPFVTQDGLPVSLKEMVQRPFLQEWGHKEKGHWKGTTGYGVLRGGFVIIISDEYLLEELRKLKSLEKSGRNIETPSLALTRSMVTFQAELPLILERVLDEAVAGLPEGAFPQKYINHVRMAMLRMIANAGPPHVGPEPGTVWIDYDFNSLGTYGQFQDAFHYKAVIKESPKGDVERVSLPYGKQRLKNYVNIRHQFWLAVYASSGSGTQYTRFQGLSVGKFKSGNWWTKGEKGLFTGSWSQQKPVSINIPPDAWEDTVDARLRYWSSLGGTLAPEWLLLEFGQPRWSPTIPRPQLSLPPGWEAGDLRPRGISGKFMTEASKRWTQILTKNMEDYFNRYPTRDAAHAVPTRTPNVTYVRGGIPLETGKAQGAGKIIKANIGPQVENKFAELQYIGNQIIFNAGQEYLTRAGLWYRQHIWQPSTIQQRVGKYYNRWASVTNFRKP